MTHPLFTTVYVTELVALHRLNQGIIRLDSPICDHSASTFLDELAYVESEVALPNGIRLEIICQGGDAYAAFAIYDAIIACPLRVTGVVYGIAASAASMIVLQACTYRFAHPNARLLIHEVRSSTEQTDGRITLVQDDVDEGQVVYLNILNVLANRMSMTVANLRKLCDRREYWLSAAKAQQLGLIDGVIHAPPTLDNVP